MTIRPYTTKETDLLIDLARKGTDISEIQEHLQRSEESIRKKLRRLKRSRPRMFNEGTIKNYLKNNYTPEEINLLVGLAIEGADIAEIAEHLQRSAEGIVKKIDRISMECPEVLDQETVTRYYKKHAKARWASKREDYLDWYHNKGGREKVRVYNQRKTIRKEPTAYKTLQTSAPPQNLVDNPDEANHQPLDRLEKIRLRALTRAKRLERIAV